MLPAADPAPLEMFATTIQFKPKSEWRAGMTNDQLVAELDRSVSVPGLSVYLLIRRCALQCDRIMVP